MKRSSETLQFGVTEKISTGIPVEGLEFEGCGTPEIAERLLGGAGIWERVQTGILLSENPGQG
jgi:hypothetical protein